MSRRHRRNRVTNLLRWTLASCLLVMTLPLQAMV